MVSTLRLLIKNASAVGFVRSMQELFCVFIPKVQTSQKTEKSTKVGQVSQNTTNPTAKVGHTLSLRGLFGVGVGRAHLHVSSKHGIADKQYGIYCPESFFGQGVP